MTARIHFTTSADEIHDGYAIADDESASDAVERSIERRLARSGLRLLGRMCPQGHALDGRGEPTAAHYSVTYGRASGSVIGETTVCISL